MKNKLILAVILAILPAVQCFAGATKEYPLQGSLISMQQTSESTTCSEHTGILTGQTTECDPNQTLHYTIKLGGLIYEVTAESKGGCGEKWPQNTYCYDPLAKMLPGGLFTARLDDKGHIWIPAPEKKNKEHEAKYNVVAVRQSL